MASGSNPVTTSPNAASNPKNYSLSLKVMRLSKPSFHTKTPIWCERDDVAGITVNEKGIESFGVSDLLTLPTAFGTIYLREVFSGYISLLNNSPFDVKNVVIQVELQTTTEKFILLDLSAKAIPLFASGDSHDYIVQHEVKESGTYILICNVKYTKHDGTRETFKKFFKFQVMNPIQVKTTSVENSNALFLTAQIKNLTNGPLFLETVKFEPLPFFTFQDLNIPDESFTFMKSGDVRQYLFRVDYKSPDDPKAKNSSIFGRLEVVWKSNFGETGRFQTAPLERKPPTEVEVQLNLKDIPSEVVLEQPFMVKCEITNRTSREIEPQVLFSSNQTSGIIPNGISGQELGRLKPGQIGSFSLTLFALKPGVQKITGIRILDKLTNTAYDFNDIMDVFCQL